MAKFVIRDPVLIVDGVDLSDHASSVTVEDSDDEVDATAFGSANKETLKGIGDASITVTFQQDFAAASVDATLWSLKSTETPFEVSVQSASGSVGPTNPIYKLTEALLFNYNPISGSVGELSTTEVQFKNAGSDGLERATA